MKELGSARFCPQPRGIAGESAFTLLVSHWAHLHRKYKCIGLTDVSRLPLHTSLSPGWSPRVNDAIYAGCIPVLTAEGTHYPFLTLLD